MLEAADAFDYRRQRRRLRGEYAQLGILSMQTLRADPKHSDFVWFHVDVSTDPGAKSFKVTKNLEQHRSHLSFVALQPLHVSTFS